MIRIFLAAVDTVPAAVVLVPLFGVLFVTKYRCDLCRTVFSCLFCLYLSAVYALVGIPNILYIRPELNLNLLPLVGMASDFKNSILNIALFVPLGIFLPLLWERFRKVRYCAAFGLCYSLAIELLQMLTFRATDINDLITNLCGTLLGFYSWHLTGQKYIPDQTKGYESVLWCILCFGIMFFVHPFLSPLLWDGLL